MFIKNDVEGKGTVFWITGLSGSGKSTVANLLFAELKKDHPNTVILDGDQLRQAIDDGLGHDLKDREKVAFRNARICKLFSDQGIHVICPTIAMFESCRTWNRENIKNYVEIYLEVPMEELMVRDPKKIYLRYKNGELKNIVGLDLPFEPPTVPTLIIKNYGKIDPNHAVNMIVHTVCQ